MPKELQSNKLLDSYKMDFVSEKETESLTKQHNVDFVRGRMKREIETVNISLANL